MSPLPSNSCASDAMRQNGTHRPIPSLIAKALVVLVRSLASKDKGVEVRLENTVGGLARFRADMESFNGNLMP
jgi:hypothetical protein